MYHVRSIVVSNMHLLYKDACPGRHNYVEHSVLIIKGIAPQITLCEEKALYQMESNQRFM